MKVFLSFSQGNLRHHLVYEAVRHAIKRLGWTQTDVIQADLAVCWGLNEAHQRLVSHFKQGGRPALVIDFPYWNRRGLREIQSASYKISLNGIHPNDYLDAGFGGAGRYAKSGGMLIRPWKKGGNYILLAGMGPKGSKMYGYKHGFWDARAAEIIRQHSDCPIIYRAKPSDKAPPYLEKVRIDDASKPIERLYGAAAAVVTHHGNSGIEALQRGIPVFCNDGPARLLGCDDLRRINDPVFPEGRVAFFEKLAWWQWTFDEICKGAPLAHLKEKGLIGC